MLAIRNLLKEPDVIAVQEVAVFADGANALTGLAQALGNYTPLHRDQQRRSRHRAGLPGQERHDGDQRRRDRRGASEPVGRAQRVRPAPGPAVRPRAVRARDQEGRHLAVALSNHFASQSHQNACRIAEAEYVRQQAATFQAGRARTSSSRVTSTTSSSPQRWARLTQGNMLTNLWGKAPAGPRLLLQVQRPPADARPHPRHRRARLARQGHALRPLRQRRTTSARPTDGTGISDHDPPVVTFELRGASTSVPGTSPAPSPRRSR